MNVETNGGVNNKILCRYDYDAFGNTISEEETIRNRYGFTGEMYDKQNGVAGVSESGSQRRILYHYTNGKGMNAIIESQKLNPSLRANNSKDARYGNGWYLSDIQLGIYSPTQLAKRFINVPNKYRYAHYVELGVTGLEVIQGRVNESPLDLVGRIVSTGKVEKN